MLMTEDVNVIKRDWQKLQQAADLFVDELYRNLFAIDPELKCLFKRSMKMQGRKVMSMFDTAISRLDQPLNLVEPLMAAGHRHDQYGVVFQHYHTMREAFIKTLAVYVDDWSEKKNLAWREAFNTMVGIMAESHGAVSSTDQVVSSKAGN